MRKSDIIRLNITAGLIAGAILGIGEVIYGEIYTRMAAKQLVTEVTSPEVAPSPGDGPRE